MSAPKFTPGPWKPCRAHEDFEGPLFDIDEEDAATYAARPFVRIEAATCAVAAAHDLFEFKEADARLIAAAPELYEALENTAALLENTDCATGYCCCGGPMASHTAGDGHAPVDIGDHSRDLALRDARAALAKARGEA